MNIKSMRIRSYRSFAVDEHVPPEAAERYRTLKAHERLRAAGCNEIGALRHVGISRRIKRHRNCRLLQCTSCAPFGRGRPPQGGGRA